MEIDTLHPLVRIADAMESIAISLGKMANPMIVTVQEPYELSSGWKVSSGGKPDEMIGTIAK